jgi:competence protein ComEC
MRSPFAVTGYLAACLSAGIWAASIFRPHISWCLPAFLSLALVLGMARLRAPVGVFWGLAGLGIGILGFWRMAATLPENSPAHYVNTLESTAPGHLQIRVVEAMRESSFSRKYLAEVIAINHRPAAGRVLLYLRKEDSIRLQPGQQLLTTEVPKPLSPPLNPGQFDYQSYLQSRGIYGQIKLSQNSYFPVRAEQDTFQGRLWKYRQNLLQNLEATGLSPGPLGIARALLLGDRNHVAPELYGNYRKAGALHLLAVSGLHVGILAAFIFGLLTPLLRLPHGKEMRLVMGILLLWGYAFLAGFSPSVVRAVILFTVVAYSVFRERPGQTLHFLALAWIFMLAVLNPLWLQHVGFLLSFAAVYGIVVFFPPLYRCWYWKRTPGAYLGKLLAVSLAAQMGTLPLTLYYFHQFPGLFLLSNLFLLPAIGLILGLGFICLGLQSFKLLPPFLIAVYDWILGLMNRAVEWIGSKKGFHFDALPWDGVQMIGCGLALILMGMYLKNRSRICLAGMGACLLAVQVWGLCQWKDAGEIHSVAIPHRVGQTGVWVRQGHLMVVFSGDSAAFSHLVQDARILWRLEEVNYRGLPNYMQIGSKRLRVLDSTGLYSPVEAAPDILLLNGSPKVHLDRLLEAWMPEKVIADGSNYYSLLPRWKASCERYGIPFHATASQGAYVQEFTRR